jgi:uncharacterized delta-60 repeat protein
VRSSLIIAIHIQELDRNRGSKLTVAMLRRPVGMGISVLMLFGAASRVHVAPGELDSTFGEGGIVTADVGRTSDAGQGVAVQPDGKIVQVGYATTDSIHFRYAVFRSNQDGSPDIGFGKAGVATAYLSNGGGYGVAVQADGGIVAVGSAVVNGYTKQGLVRFMPDGRLDTAFGSGGVVVNEAGLPGYEIEVQPDGKILTLAPDLLTRYEPDGTLDQSFGAGGMVQPIPDAMGLALLADGRIIVAGTDVYEDPSVVVARYLATGELDATFGDAGQTRTPLGKYVFAYAVSIQADGGIVVAGGIGVSQPNIEHYLLVRYLEDGLLDSDFGRQGVVVTPVPGDHAAVDIAIQGNGRIVVVGSSGNFPRSDFAVARYLSDGKPDLAFGSGGLVITKIGHSPQPPSGPQAVVLQADGKIVVSGTALARLPDFALLRYLAT